MWVGPPIPAFVPLVDGQRELYLLDPDAHGGYLAVYHYEFYDYSAAYYDASGTRTWTLDLGPFCTSRIDDVHLASTGVLYFNDGNTGQLIAVDSRLGRLLWRSGLQLSQGTFDFVGDFLVVSHELDHKNILSLVRTADGRVMRQLSFDNRAWGISNLHVEQGTAGPEAVFCLSAWCENRIAITGAATPTLRFGPLHLQTQ